MRRPRRRVGLRPERGGVRRCLRKRRQSSCVVQGDFEGKRWRRGSAAVRGRSLGKVLSQIKSARIELTPVPSGEGGGGKEKSKGAARPKPRPLHKKNT
jgi:hypothetical protein